MWLCGDFNQCPWETTHPPQPSDLQSCMEWVCQNWISPKWSSYKFNILEYNIQIINSFDFQKIRISHRVFDDGSIIIITTTIYESDIGIACNCTQSW